MDQQEKSIFSFFKKVGRYSALNGTARMPTMGKKHPNLHNLRQEIDRLDNYVLELLAERMEIAKQIGAYKKDNNIAIYQPKRWAYTVKRALEIGKTNGLSEEFILALFQKIHKASIDKQTED